MLQNNWSVILKTIKVMKAKGKTEKLFQIKEILNATCDSGLDFFGVKEHYWDNW